MFCSRCGLAVKEGNRYCQGCGQEIGVPATGAPAAVNAPPADSRGAASSGAFPPLSYAGFWLRVVAYLIDGLILGVPFLFVVMVFMFLLGGFGLVMRRNAIEPHASFALAGPMVLGIMTAILFLIILKWLYFAGMESSQRQATFGKMAMSLRVTDLEGQRLSFGHATGRFFAKIVSSLIPLGIGYIMAGFTEKKQALHDMIAGTLVVRG